jgi:hypothetical protein
MRIAQKNPQRRHAPLEIFSFEAGNYSAKRRVE